MGGKEKGYWDFKLQKKLRSTVWQARKWTNRTKRKKVLSICMDACEHFSCTSAMHAVKCHPQIPMF